MKCYVITLQRLKQAKRGRVRTLFTYHVGTGGEGVSRKGIEMLCDYSSEAEISEEWSGKDTLYLPCGGRGRG